MSRVVSPRVTPMRFQLTRGSASARVEKLPSRLLELAEKNPQSPLALDALVWRLAYPAYRFAANRRYRRRREEPGRHDEGVFSDYFLTPRATPMRGSALLGTLRRLGLDIVNYEDYRNVHGLLAHPITLIHRPMRNTLIDEIIDSIRSRAGTRSIAKKSAALVSGAKIFRFDGSDKMPVAMSDAFLKGILDFTKDQTKLDSILTGLDGVQASAYGG